MTAYLPHGHELDGLPAKLYEVCLRQGPKLIADLRQRLAADGPELDEAIKRLTALNLLQPLGPDEVAPLPPQPALRGAAQQLEDAAEALRDRSPGWQQLWRQFRESGSFVEMLMDARDLEHLDRNLLPSARREVRSMQREPIGPPPGAPPGPVVHPRLPPILERGVRVRALYESNMLADPAVLAIVHSCIDLGEEVRVFPQAPMQVLLVDDLMGVLMVPDRLGARRYAVVVHPSGLLDSLIELFECFWQMSVPMGLGTRVSEPGADEGARQMLAYLAAGLTDESIARELSISERTVGRRIARLQQLLGARSRFQLAVQATRRGWI